MAGGYFTTSAVPAQNTTIGGIAATGVDPSGNIDNLFQELAAYGRQYANDIGGPLATGSANALTITLSSGNLAANFNGFMCGFIAAYDNSSTSVTAQIAGGAASATVYKSVSGTRTALAVGDIQAGSMYFLRYRTDWSGWQLIDLNHPAATTVTVTFANLSAALVVTSSEGIGNNDNDTTIPTSKAVSTYVTSAMTGKVPVGTVADYGGASAPSGWLLCYGQAVSRSTYSALYSAIGTAFGTGDGSTTFNLPDCRGRVTAGKDNMGGTSANRLTNQTGGLDGDVLGGTGGAETHALTAAQIPPNETRLVGDGGDGPTVATQWHNGTGTAHNNVQPTIILNKIIFTGV